MDGGAGELGAGELGAVELGAGELGAGGREMTGRPGTAWRCCQGEVVGVWVWGRRRLHGLGKAGG